MTGGVRVLVCDDDARRVTKWAKSISEHSEFEAGEVKALAPHEFAALFRALQSRREEARGIEIPTFEQSDALLEEIDAAELVVIDYDLTPDSDRKPDPEADHGALEELTGKSGEDFAYLVRCFTSARAVIVVNQHRQRKAFDLTLQRFVHSYADLNVNSWDLSREALWTGAVGADAYRPWYWPIPADLSVRSSERLEMVPDDLDSAVLDVLGFDDEQVNRLTPEQVDPLGTEPAELTFRKMAEGSAWGLSGRDAEASQPDERLRRVAAFALGRWLDAVVVPAQNILIDAPHLVQRYPIFGPLRSGSDDFDGESAPGTPGSEALQGAQISASKWCSRPTWALSRLTKNVSARDLASRPDGPIEVFCEDTSCFVDLGAATEFRSAVSGPYNQRFVARLDEVEYLPIGRLAD